MNSESDTIRMEPYIESRALFVEWCAKIPLAIPIEFGSVGCPGLSDIDIGIVFKKDFVSGDYDLCKDLVHFPEKTKILMNGGSLMIFPETVFKHILLIDDICVRSLTDNIYIEKNNDVEKYLVDLVQIIEWLPERIAKIYLELKNTNINTKRLIGYFYSLCYSLKKIQMYAGENKKINNFITNVCNLRKEWFSSDEIIINAMLEDMAYIYIDVFIEAANTIIPILDKHFKVVQLNKLETQYNIYKNINFVGAEQDDIGISECNDNIYINIPTIFLCSYFAYSRYSSYLCSIIARRIRVKGADIVISEEMGDILERRAHIISSLFDFVKTMRCATGLYKFGWYLNE